jgi:hypothetical protein
MVKGYFKRKNCAGNGFLPIGRNEGRIILGQPDLKVWDP